MTSDKFFLGKVSRNHLGLEHLLCNAVAMLLVLLIGGDAR